MKPRKPTPRAAQASGNPGTTRTMNAARVDSASRGVWIVTFLAIVSTCIWYYIAASSVIVQAELALGRGDILNALGLASQELRTHPDSDRALMVAGSASLARKDLGTAKACFERVSDKRPQLFALAQRESGQIALNAGYPFLAEGLLRRSLQITPNDVQTQNQLIYLLTLEGRIWEARELIFEQLRAGVVSVNYLVLASRPDRILESSTKYAEQCLLNAPHEPLPRLVLAQQAWRENQWQVARRHLEQVLEKHPDLLEAHALLSRMIAESGTPQEFEQVIKQLPPNSQTHPEIWLSQGLFAENHHQTEAAARCFWEALRLNPNLADANSRLARALIALKRPEDAHPFAERAKQLMTLSLELVALTNKYDSQTLPPIISQLESLGRYWEAAGWCQLVLQEKGPPPAWARQTQARLCGNLSSSLSYTAPALDPSRQLDLSHYALPTFHVDPPLPPSLPQNSGTMAKITFQDDAVSAGLAFTYRNGAAEDDTESMFEMNGGGVAVLDYDGDNWPDVYFTQGGNLPPASLDSTQTDQLFRNRAGKPDGSADNTSFQNVTATAKLRDAGYGQGITVGDFDNDGFADLFIGNIGRSQFYHNNGDGTFSDVTSLTETQAVGWASSCVLADVNQDGWPDLYVVTYLGGDTPYTPCRKRATPRCSPLNYPAEPDRFYLNLGDGRFQDLTGKNGLAAPEGRGLGVVAADFDGSRRLSLFVGNDMSANFFFRNTTTAPDGFQVEEQALLSGLAFDYLGHAKACMGIAAGDYNHDERLDLYVTNFYRQSNDLYTQQPDGTFRDLSREAQLFGPSYLVLGWGTQFLDADLDGFPDLMITNGHVHDPMDLTIPYFMTAQFFRNQGDGKFAEPPLEQLGAYFQQKLLGRSLARLDWNRDGREDVCISHLNDPAALLTNRTRDAGNFLALRLVARNSARDAIGTKIRVSIGEQRITNQLTAGDGFHASNERKLIVGLGSHKVADAVEVHWPSGLQQTFRGLKLNREWLLIEQNMPIDITPSAMNLLITRQ